jgi:hypothetical protein
MPPAAAYFSTSAFTFSPFPFKVPVSIQDRKVIQEKRLTAILVYPPFAKIGNILITADC